MKKLLFIVIVFLISISVNAQKIGALETAKDTLTTYRIATATSNLQIGFGTIAPTHSVVFCNDSITFHIDFRGDSLKVGGNMPMSKSAELFIEWCRKYMKTKIDSLELENKRLWKLLNNKN